MDRQVKGILGAKLGMTQVWDNNKVVPVTVVPIILLRIKPREGIENIILKDFNNRHK